LKQKNRFFTFVQTEHGDLFKVSLVHEGADVSELTVKYFDTIPPASVNVHLQEGFLFAASEFGDHHLYQFLGLGDDDAVESSSVEVKLENGAYDVGDGYGWDYGPGDVRAKVPDGEPGQGRHVDELGADD
jgi:splicing factor 3B subunit 3